ncbi:MAG: 4Fe-4S dicluster domain-containing protein [Bacteroidota bacterium]|nr:4Fe-4S dicluster domain-containing protein [Bacteroidota bacterium]
MALIKSELKQELKKYGAVDFNACYNCGNCTAVCSLSTEDNSFPREIVRYSVLGLEEELQSSLKPWLCYYCGECTTKCPQQAKPGELMMSIRRWLTARYDWTGLSGLLYKSGLLTMIAFIIIAIAELGFIMYEDFNVMKIMHYGHYFEMFAIAGVFIVIFLPNIIRMWYFTMLKTEVKMSVKSYSIAVKDLFVHMFTQKRALDCNENKFRWLEHFILVISYLSLLFTTVFLDWFASENLFVIILGYIESAVIFIVTFDFVLSRIKKNKEMNTFSQPSDWYFVVWLLLMGVTAFLVRLFIDIDLMESNAWLYYFHLMILVQWALIIVPFGKWTHFLYRSFAMYFAKIQEISK